jgi:hypothetical protein
MTDLSFSDLFDFFLRQAGPGLDARGDAIAKANKAYRIAVFRKYKTKGKITTPNPMEIAIDKAAKPFEREEMVEFSNGTFPRKTLDGWFDPFADGPASEHVVAAIRNAIPLPTTIAAAKAEADAWEKRNDELNVAWDHAAGLHDMLSLGCSLRLKIVEDLLYTGLRATSVTDALVRVKAIGERYLLPPSEEENAAMLADLEHLARLEQRRGPQS